MERNSDPSDVMDGVRSEEPGGTGTGIGVAKRRRIVLPTPAAPAPHAPAGPTGTLLGGDGETEGKSTLPTPTIPFLPSILTIPSFPTHPIRPILPSENSSMLPNSEKKGNHVDNSSKYSSTKPSGDNSDEGMDEEMDEGDSRSDVTVDENEDVFAKEYCYCTLCCCDLNHPLYHIHQHPFLKVPLCASCHEKFQSTTFEAINQHPNDLCQWCGDGGDLLLCDDCDYTICKPCIESHCSNEVLKSCEEAEEWYCFACDESPIHGFVQVVQSRDDTIPTLDRAYQVLYGVEVEILKIEEALSEKVLLEKEYQILGELLETRRPEEDVHERSIVEMKAYIDFWKHHEKLIHSRQCEIQDVIEELGGNLAAFYHLQFDNITSNSRGNSITKKQASIRNGDVNNGGESLEMNSYVSTLQNSSAIPLPSLTKQESISQESQPADDSPHRDRGLSWISYLNSRSSSEDSNDVDGVTQESIPPFHEPLYDEETARKDPIIAPYCDRPDVNLTLLPPEVYNGYPIVALKALFYAQQDGNDQDVLTICQRYKIGREVSILMKYLECDDIVNQEGGDYNNVHPMVMIALRNSDDLSEFAALEGKFGLSDETIGIDDLGDADEIYQEYAAYKGLANSSTPVRKRIALRDIRRATTLEENLFTSTIPLSLSKNKMIKNISVEEIKKDPPSSSRQSVMRVRKRKKAPLQSTTSISSPALEGKTAETAIVLDDDDDDDDGERTSRVKPITPPPPLVPFQAVTSRQRIGVRGSSIQNKRPLDHIVDTELESKSDNRSSPSGEISQLASPDAFILNKDYDEMNEKPVAIHPLTASRLKTHQKDALRFLWENVMKGVSIPWKSSTAPKRYISPKEAKDPCGCLLAHAMGLGKTFTIIAFITTLLSNPIIRSIADAENGQKSLFFRVLILVPVNVVCNWLAEFYQWTPPDIQRELRIVMIDSCFDQQKRYDEIKRWYEVGGVCIIGFEMFQSLLKSSRSIDTHQKEPTKDSSPSPNVQVNQQTKAADRYTEYLLKGPDIVVIDEAHKIKDLSTQFCKQIAQFATKRRIAMTGSPIQNNLLEYWNMIDFISPGFLGTKKSFTEKFKVPIEKGEARDADASDVKLMKQKLYVLSKKLSKIANRVDTTQFEKELPKLREYLIAFELTSFQIYLRDLFLQSTKVPSEAPIDSSTVEVTGKKPPTSPIFKIYHTMMRICNHPGCLPLEDSTKINNLPDIISALTNAFDGFMSIDYDSSDDEGDVNNCSQGSRRSSNHGSSQQESNRTAEIKMQALLGTIDSPMSIDDDDEEDDDTIPERILTSSTPIPTSSTKLTQKDASGEAPIGNHQPTVESAASTDEQGWWKVNNGNNSSSTSSVQVSESDFIGMSNKIVFLLQILSEVVKKREKMVVFSQNLPTLNLIEIILSKDWIKFIDTSPTSRPDVDEETLKKCSKWAQGKHYQRLDGATNGQMRQSRIKDFNEKPECHLFLISTHAGNAGINLQTANRVVIFDCSWNPATDKQAVHRCYRFGQKKEVFVYRLVALNSLEETVFKRQVKKSCTALRLLDKSMPANMFKEKEYQQLFVGRQDHVVTGGADNDSPAEDDIIRSAGIDYSIVKEDDILRQYITPRSRFGQSRGGAAEAKGIVAVIDYDALLRDEVSEHLDPEEAEEALLKHQEEEEREQLQITHRQLQHAMEHEFTSGNSQYREQNWAEALKFYCRYVDLVLQASEPGGVRLPTFPGILSKISDCCNKFENGLEKSIEYFTHICKKYSKKGVGHHYFAIEIRKRLAILHVMKSEIANAVSYLEANITAFQAINDAMSIKEIILTMCSIGEVYIRGHVLEAAESWYIQALAMSKIHDHCNYLSKTIEDTLHSVKERCVRK